MKAWLDSSRSAPVIPRQRAKGASIEAPFRFSAPAAAAYLFYLRRNHPFIDGNKRVAFGSCVLFLRLNGVEPSPDGPEWESLVLDVAASRLDRDQTTARLQALLAPRKHSKK